MHYVNHDPKQSIQIENEYQKALLDKKKEHAFILSGDWDKNRCKWEYEIKFEDLNNSDVTFHISSRSSCLHSIDHGSYLSAWTRRVRSKRICSCIVHFHNAPTLLYSRAHTYSHTLIHSHTLTHTFIHTHLLTHTRSRTHSLTHTYTRTHTNRIQKWFKINTLTKKQRPISRIEIWMEIEEILVKK